MIDIVFRKTRQTKLLCSVQGYDIHDPIIQHTRAGHPNGSDPAMTGHQLPYFSKYLSQHSAPSTPHTLDLWIQYALLCSGCFIIHPYRLSTQFVAARFVRTRQSLNVQRKHTILNRNSEKVCTFPYGAVRRNRPATICSRGLCPSVINWI